MLSLRFVLRLANCLTLLLGLAAPTRLNAQAGSVDNSFTPTISPAADVVAVVLQADRKILLGGSFTQINGEACNRVARLNVDGSLDAGFNHGGANDAVYAVAVQPDGKAIIGGSFTQIDGITCGHIARLNIDGTLDSGFNVGSGADGTIYSVAVQIDGKIVLGGAFANVNGGTHYYIARLNTNGSVDSGFSAGTNGSVYTVASQSDGKVLLGGDFTQVDSTDPAFTRYFIARVNNDGTLDTGFTIGTDNTVLSIVVQTNGKITFGGSFSKVQGATQSIVGIARVNQDGGIDAGFDPGSGVNSGAVRTVAVQADDKILIGGDFDAVNGVTRYRVARLNVDGNLDASFVPGGGANNLVFGVAMQADGKIIVGGRFKAFDTVARASLVRLNGDPPLVTAAKTTNAQVNQPFSYEITASFNPTSFGATTLPPGLSLDTAAGVIGGIPTNIGSYTFDISATNASGTGTATVTLTVTAPPQPPVITSAVKVAASIGVAFSFIITATNTPTNFTAAGLPPGLSLDSTNGLISGTPTQVGLFNTILTATNAGGTGTAALTITITVPPANIMAVNILSPPTNIAIVAGETIDLQVAVEAVNGTLVTVEFDVTDAGGTKTYLGNSTASRDHKTWNPTALGDFTLSATATDTTGKTARSEIPIHVVAGTNPPVSQLLSGLDGKNFAAGSTLSLVALATDANGNALSNVQFYLDGVVVPGATVATAAAHRQDAAASPYAKANAKLGNLIGDALLTITGTDNRGVTSVSKAATVHVTAATAIFTCTLTGPDGSGTYAPGESVTATASALETGGSVARVEYFLNDQSVGVANGADFALTFPLPGTVGQYVLTAIATDTKGVSAASAPVILSAVEMLLPPPVVTITGNASVKEGGNAKLVVRREGGDTNKAITVRYKLAGAVKAGTDYKPLTGMVILAAGTPTAKLKLKTIDNTSVDGTRVVKVKLLPSTDGTYTLGTPAATKLKITDND